MKLTATNVRTLSVPRGRTEAVFFDDDVKGFGVRVKPSGARSYVMCWKVDGIHWRVTIGSVSDTDFGKAKNRAKDIKADVRRGEDPAAEIMTAKLETSYLRGAGSEVPRSHSNACGSVPAARLQGDRAPPDQARSTP